ncbi:MAG: DUF268 domain-containing protein [Burkholderiales bacterium]
MQSKLRNFLIRWFGLVLNLRGVLSIHRLAPFGLQWRRFARGSGIPAPAADLFPCLTDASAKTGFDPHYFFQSAWLARKLAASRPAVHMDIASDVGMVGVLSAFVPVEFLDIRPLDVVLPGLTSRRGDLSSLALPSDSVSSLSCLHVLEHIGLGRYGDPLDSDGHVKAAGELSRVLAYGGDLYLSVPVGRERACFNAHRVFSVATIQNLFAALDLSDFALVDDHGRFLSGIAASEAGSNEYGCGMFHFAKRRRAASA